MISEDKKLALCQRTQNTHPNKNGNGWWHSLASNISPDQTVIVKRTVKPKAPDRVLHQVYSQLMEYLPLASMHWNKILARGLTSMEITEQGYRSLTTHNRIQVTKSLLNKFGESTLATIPGFYVCEGPYGEYWTLFGGSGFMVPVKNETGLIVGIQVRLDQPTRNTKYLWLSTDGKKNGTSSGNPCHIAIPPEVTSGDIWITEGPLKANVIAWRKKCIAIAAPGVAHWKAIPDLVHKLHVARTLHGKNIIAYDAEFDTKPWVKQYALNLAAALSERQLAPYIATWSAFLAKGIDELILLNHYPTLLPTKTFTEPKV
jgi:hypothetical protein